MSKKFGLVVLIGLLIVAPLVVWLNSSGKLKKHFISLKELPGVSSDVLEANGRVFRIHEPFFYNSKTGSASLEVAILDRRNFDTDLNVAFQGDAKSLQLLLNEIRYVNSLSPSTVRLLAQGWNGLAETSLELVKHLWIIVKHPWEFSKDLGQSATKLAGYATDWARGRVNPADDIEDLLEKFLRNTRCKVASEHGLNYLELRTSIAREATDFEANARIGGRSALELALIFVPFTEIKYAEEAGELARVAEASKDAAAARRYSELFLDAAVAARQANRLTPRTYKTFDAFKRAMGPAGDGMDWHHIVEQSQVGRFSAEEINNTENIISVSERVNSQLNRVYSSIRPDITGSTSLTVRQWLAKKSYGDARKFGIKALQNVESGVWP